MVRVARLILTASVFLALPASAAARPGDLDSGYGEGGARSVAPGAVTSSARALAAAPDGSAVVAGRAIQGGAERVLVTRLTAAGGLDRAFAGTGTVLARFGADSGPPQRAQAVALQPDGKALVAGKAGINWFVARYTATGALDPSFGAGGVVLEEVPIVSPGEGGEDPPDAPLAGIAVRQDGRILLLGSLPQVGFVPDYGSIVLLGLRADGKPDPAVGGDGMVISQLGAASRFFPVGLSAAEALALLPDGRALVAGSATDRTGADQPVIARYRANGRLDTSFGERGKRVVAVNPAGVPSRGFEGMALSPDGTIVAAGIVSGPQDAVVARLTPDGGLDRSFARGGVARMQLGFGRMPATTGVGVAVDLAGRPVLSAQALAVDRRRSSLVVARLQSDGAFDCSFGSAGRARAFPGRDGEQQDPAEGGAIVPLAGDDVLVAGARLAGRRAAAFVARFRGGAGAPPAAEPPAVTTGGLVSRGRGTASIVGLVDPGCSATRWAFEYGERSLTQRTPWQTIPGAVGPQDVCARLTGLRPGRRYRARLVARSRGGRATGAALAFTAKRAVEASRCSI